jgi:hypothetical protein
VGAAFEVVQVEFVFAFAVGCVRSASGSSLPVSILLVSSGGVDHEWLVGLTVPSGHSRSSQHSGRVPSLLWGMFRFVGCIRMAANWLVMTASGVLGVDEVPVWPVAV